VQFIRHQPHILLQKFIESYWVLHTDSSSLEIPLLANASTTIFINLGNTKEGIDSFKPLKPGRIYMGGPATSARFFNCFPGNIFVGIRFKPGGLCMFYRVPLAEMVDKVVEFEDRQLSYILDMDDRLPSRLDEYFLSKKKQAYPVFNLADVVYQYKGQISVDMLARESNMSNRTLERYFFNHVGIGPKEFINIVRFKEVMASLNDRSVEKEFAKIAIEMGYYDQSHFIKEIKRRAGSIPTAIESIFNLRTL